jgi:hypothetical protein
MGRAPDPASAGCHDDIVRTQNLADNRSKTVFLRVIGVKPGVAFLYY